jgi:aminoglycoside phosphotransferase (APT) family kinase protein
MPASLQQLANEPIEPLGTGWAFWAYRAGDTVLRFPRDAEFTQTLAVEAAVMRDLAPTLPLPVAAIEVHEDGPNGLPFTSHHFVPGVTVEKLTRPLAPTAGAVMGKFLKAMHDFPVARAAALGLVDPTPQQRRDNRQRFFVDVQARVLPLISVDARSHLSATFEAFLADASNFAGPVAVSHGDINPVNVLADPSTGELTGVIDWGDLTIDEPAGDLTSVLYGYLGEAGLSAQLLALFDAYGITHAELDLMRPRCRFGAYCLPLQEILYCLAGGNPAGLPEAIEFLYETIERYERWP